MWLSDLTEDATEGMQKAVRKSRELVNEIKDFVHGVVRAWGVPRANEDQNIFTTFLSCFLARRRRGGTQFGGTS